MKKKFLWIYFKEKFKLLRVALDLQAREYERRLTDLNGEAGRLKDIQSQYTPREVFDRTMNELREKIEIINLWKTKQEGKSQLLQYIPWLLTIISLISMWIMNR